MNTRIDRIEYRLAMVEEQLQQMAMVKPRTPRGHEAQAILELVAKEFGLSVETLTSPDRREEIVNPRWVAIRFMRESLLLSLNQIGAVVGRSDHATIHHALRSLPWRLDHDPKLRAHFEALQPKIARLIEEGK